MDLKFYLNFFAFLLCEFIEIDCVILVCTPKIKFTNCLASNSKENLQWNVNEESTIVIPLAINRSCANSLIEIRWFLLFKESGRMAVDLRKYHNKQVVVFNPKTLQPNDYTLTVRVTERGYIDIRSTAERKCWIRVLKNSFVSEEIFISNDTVLHIETNTASTGWRYCANPNMPVKYYPVLSTIYFEEVENFEKLASPRLKWSKINNGSVTLNNTDLAKSYLERKGLEFGLISNLHYNRKYRFSHCSHKKSLSTLDCRNLTEITTCPNYALDVSCNPSSDFNTRYSYRHVFTIHCELSRNIGNYISYGVYSLGGKHPNSNGPEDILIAYTKNYRNVNFRLHAGFEHKIRLIPIEYESHVRFKCIHPQHCMKSTATFRVLSDVLQDEVEDKFLRLRQARDGKLHCEECPAKLDVISHSFDSLVDLGKISEAVQLAHMLLRDLEEITTVGDLERNKFQLSLLEKFGSIASWSWFDLELMLGLIPFFDMEGVSKEISHTKAKAALLKKMMASMKRLVLANSHPVTIQLDMEEIFFKCFYRQISHLFDTDFVKPFSFKVPKVEMQPFHAGIDEKYPDYDSQFQELFDDYATSIEDALDALSSILFARSKTHTFKDEHLEAFERNVISKMWLEFKSLEHINTKINDVISINIGNPVYLPPLDFEFRFIWTLLPKDTFFWESSLRNTFPYLIFTFYAGNEHVNTEFHQNPVVQYRVDKITVPVRSDGVVVPENVDEWRQDVMERFIRVYRVKVDELTGFTLAIFLSDIRPVRRLRVILTQNQRKPTLEDFNHDNVTIVFNGEKVSEFVKILSRGYWYIAVLPFKEDIQETQIRDKRQSEEPLGESEAFVPEEKTKSKRLRTVDVSYVFAIISYSCLMWKNRSFHHDICTVGSGTTVEKIECECAEVGHPMTVSVVPMSYKTYGILDIPMKLTLVVEYTVIVATLVAIFLYCLLLSLQPCRSQKSEIICFLSDNERSDRYGYIVKVKTASMVNSGTTSRIGIQLYGAQSESKKHILNYPDPKLELLQNGQSDLFFLATEKSLGNLERVEIWSDCHGRQPDWFCENIRVCDMQTRCRWFFNVQKKLSLQKGCGNHFYVKAAAPNKVRIRSPWVYFHLHFGGSHTWNVFNKSQDVYWLYLERLTVMLSHIVCTFSLALYFINPITFEYQDGVAIGRYDDVGFYAKVIFGVTILVAPINYFFAVILRSSRKTSRFLNNEGYYPAAFRNILWFILMFIIVTCLTYCLVYGPFLSHAILYDWSIVVIISLLINVFICENLFLTIHNFIQLGYYRINKNKKNMTTTFRYKEIVKDVESQRRFLYNKTDSKGLRSYLTHLYKPLSPQKLQKRQERNEKSTSLRRTLDNMIDIWMLTFFLFLLIPFYFNEKSSEYSRHLRDIFVEGRFHDVSMGIDEISTYEELYKYLNESIVHAISPRSWYDPYTVGDAGYINDISSKIIGNVNIRQERVNTINCPVIEITKQLFNITKCVDTYREMFPVKNSSIGKKYRHDFSNWQTKGKGGRYKGILATYKGSGYSVLLGKSRQNVLYRIKILKDNEWLDEKTKLIVIEMLLYNSNANLFADVKLIFEREAKLLFPAAVVKPVQLVNQDDRTERLYILICTMYFVLGAKIFFGTIFRVFRKKWSVLTDPFSVGLIFLQLLNICYLFLFFIRLKYREDFLNVFKNSERNKFLPYSHAIQVHKLTETCLSLMVFVIILLNLQCVKFISWTRSTLTALKISRSTFLLFFFNFLRIIFSFGLIGHVLFGPTNLEFVSSLNGSLMFVLFFIKNGLYNSLWKRLWFENGNIVIWTYLTSFVMLSTLKICLIITCITSLRQARMSTSLDQKSFSLDSFVLDALGGIMNTAISKFKLIKRMILHDLIRLRGGGSKTFVTPKPAKYRFKNLVCVNEKIIEQQRLVTIAYLRNFYQRTNEEIDDTDFELMSKIVGCKLAKDRNEIYFKERVKYFPDCETELISDEKLKYMAYITEQLLESDIDHPCGYLDLEDSSDEIPLGKKTKMGAAGRIRTLQENQLKQLTFLSEILDETDNIVNVVSKGLLGSEIEVGEGSTLYPNVSE